MGPNAGLYERATAPAICEYFSRVLEEHLLPSGQVRFLAMTDYAGDMRTEHHVVSRLTGRRTDVVVRRKVVDARFLEASVPATHTPSFEVDPQVRFIPVNDLVNLADPGSGFTIVGAGKTAMDACVWLLDQGVDPDAIRWIRPRDAWLLDRRFQQPLKLLPALVEGVSLYVDAAAEAESRPDLFRRLEDCGQLMRLDPRITPAMYRCATVSDTELGALRSVEHVIRLGRVRRLGTDTITLTGGSIPTDRRQIHVDARVPQRGDRLRLVVCRRRLGGGEPRRGSGRRGDDRAARLGSGPRPQLDTAVRLALHALEQRTLAAPPTI